MKNGNLNTQIRPAPTGRRPRCAGSKQMAADFFYFCSQRYSGTCTQVLARPSGSRLKAGQTRDFRRKPSVNPASASKLLMNKNPSISELICIFGQL